MARGKPLFAVRISLTRVPKRFSVLERLWRNAFGHTRPPILQNICFLLDTENSTQISECVGLTGKVLRNKDLHRIFRGRAGVVAGRRAENRERAVPITVKNTIPKPELVSGCRLRGRQLSLDVSSRSVPTTGGTG